MPAAAVASLTPAIAGIAGTSVGARGETAVDMQVPLRPVQQSADPGSYRSSMSSGPVEGVPRRRTAGHFGPAMTTVNTIGLMEVTANFYFFAGAILESAGFAAASAGLAGSAGLAASGFAAVSAGLSVRSILAASRSLPTYSACALRVT